MKIKFKATSQKIYLITLIVFIFFNLVLLFFVSQFVYNNVYKIMFMSREDLLLHSNIKVEDIDLNKFDEVVGKIKERQNKSDIQISHDIFY